MKVFEDMKGSWLPRYYFDIIQPGSLPGWVRHCLQSCSGCNNSLSLPSRLTREMVERRSAQSDQYNYHKFSSPPPQTWQFNIIQIRKILSGLSRSDNKLEYLEYFPFVPQTQCFQVSTWYWRGGCHLTREDPRTLEIKYLVISRHYGSTMYLQCVGLPLSFNKASRLDSLILQWHFNKIEHHANTNWAFY